MLYLSPIRASAKAGSELLLVELAEGGAGSAGSLGVTSATGQAPCATAGSA